MKDREKKWNYKGRNESKRVRHGWYGDGYDETQNLSKMRCERTSSVEECSLRARSTHGGHHAIFEVNIVIDVVLGEVLVAHVVPLVVDAVIGLTLGLIAHFVVVVFVVAILKRILLYRRCTANTPVGDSKLLLAVTEYHCNSASN